MIPIIIGIFLFLGIIYNIFILYFDKKIKKLEAIIILAFEKRTHLVPALFELTKKYISKHDDVFREIIHLRKIEFSNYEEDFIKRVRTEILIHHELNFIFKIIQQHPKIFHESNYLLLRDLFLENSEEIGKKIMLYKHIIRTFNRVLPFKNITLLGIFIDIKKRSEI